MPLAYTAEKIRRIQQEKLSANLDEKLNIISERIKEQLEDPDEYLIDNIITQLDRNSPKIFIETLRGILEGGGFKVKVEPSEFNEDTLDLHIMWN